MSRSPLLILVFFFTLPLAAQPVYKHVDEDGNVVFTDQPQGDAQRVEIREPNTISAPPELPQPPEPERKPEPEAIEYKVSIVSPANDTVIPRGPGNFSVSASLTPALRTGHRLQLLMDGAPREEPQTGTSWALTNVFRGTHALEVAVIDGDGKQLGKSAPVTVYVFRPSSNFRNN